MTKAECREKISKFFERVKYISGSTKAAVRRNINQFFESMNKKQD